MRRLVALAMASLPAPALAQLAGSVSIESDLRWRAYTLSAGHPVATAQLGYDDRSGLYAFGSATVQVAHDEPDYLGFQAGAGFARRLSPTLSIDAGAVHSNYGPAYPGGTRYEYSELYLGLNRDPLVARISYSPDYFGADVHVVYGELDGSLPLGDRLRLNGHAGLLSFVDRPAPRRPSPTVQYDWRIGVTRRFGAAEVHAGLSAGGPNRQFYAGELHNRLALTMGASWGF